MCTIHTYEMHSTAKPLAHAHMLGCQVHFTEERHTERQRQHLWRMVGEQRAQAHTHSHTKCMRDENINVRRKNNNWEAAKTTNTSTFWSAACRCKTLVAKRDEMWYISFFTWQTKICFFFRISNAKKKLNKTTGVSDDLMWQIWCAHVSGVFVSFAKTQSNNDSHRDRNFANTLFLSFIRLPQISFADLIDSLNNTNEPFNLDSVVDVCELPGQI